MAAPGTKAVDARATSSSSGYDAFVSYSHAADGRLAPALQAGLQSLAKPWYRRRALRVFRDRTSLSASPELALVERHKHWVKARGGGPAAALVGGVDGALEDGRGLRAGMPSPWRVKACAAMARWCPARRRR